LAVLVVSPAPVGVHGKTRGHARVAGVLGAEVGGFGVVGGAAVVLVVAAALVLGAERAALCFGWIGIFLY